MEINISLKFVDELNQIDWFANCKKGEGEAEAPALSTAPIDYIMKNREEYNQWNRLVREVKGKHLSKLRKNGDAR